MPLGEWEDVVDYLQQALQARLLFDGNDAFETAERFVKILQTLQPTHRRQSEEPLKLFPKPEDYDEMVVMKDISVVSFCEHHLLPFAGRAHIAYIPKEAVVGASKLARLVKLYAQRPQLQERLTCQIANHLWNFADPVGVGVILECQHTCMSCRGVGEQNAVMVTSKLLGAMREDAKARSEFLSLTLRR